MVASHVLNVQFVYVHKPSHLKQDDTEQRNMIQSNKGRLASGIRDEHLNNLQLYDHTVLMSTLSQ